VPRLLQLVALTLALLVMGAPTWITEIAQDDCGDECKGDEAAGGCDERGCTDCPVVCNSCSRTHMLPPLAVLRLDFAMTAFVHLASDLVERMPVGPPPRGIFHPPRAG